MTALAPYLSAFLLEHLPRERNASPHTSDMSGGLSLRPQLQARRLLCGGPVECQAMPSRG